MSRITEEDCKRYLRKGFVRGTYLKYTDKYLGGLPVSEVIDPGMTWNEFCLELTLAIAGGKPDQ